MAHVSWILYTILSPPYREHNTIGYLASCVHNIQYKDEWPGRSNQGNTMLTLYTYPNTATTLCVCVCVSCVCANVSFTNTSQRVWCVRVHTLIVSRIMMYRYCVFILQGTICMYLNLYCSYIRGMYSNTITCMGINTEISWIYKNGIRVINIYIYIYM